MNLTQWSLLIAPIVLGYALFVWKAEIDGRVQYVANLLSGLIVVPLLALFLPALMCHAHAEGWRRGKKDQIIGTAIALALMAGYAVLIFQMRDPQSAVVSREPVKSAPTRSLPAPADLPVERDNRSPP